MTPAKLVIVEDEVIVARDLRGRLERLGYSVVGTTGNGEAAVALVESVRPDLVLMDICIHGALDGIAAAEVIRKRFFVPVIYVTAHADEATLERARISEPYGYILKPFEERELRTAIEIGLYKHQAERRLRESEQRFATTLASIGDGVVATDAQGLVTYLNPVAEKLLGWSLVECQGKHLSEVFRIVDETTRIPLDSPVDRVLREGVVVGLANHTVLTTRDGKEIPIDDCASPILDEHHNVTGAVLVFRDISLRRRLEEQLRQSQKMEAIGQLAGGIAHDFNNQLTAILGYTDVILNSAGPSHDWSGYLEEIQRASERAADLTRQLLAFSRKQLLTPKVLDLNLVVSTTKNMIRRLLFENIEIRILFSPTPCAIKADLGQVEQVLVNLAVNGRDAMPQGGILTIETSNILIEGPDCDTSPGMRPGSYCRLCVTDTGSGIPPEIKERIFEPFFTTKDVAKGTGLGLATVYSIMQQCLGYIHVNTKVGSGTTFSLYFPTTDEPIASPIQTTKGTYPRGKETILLAEDEAPVRHLVHRLLNSSGYTVLEAENGVKALELAKSYEGGIDLLITDMVMPFLGGYTLVQSLMEVRPAIKVLCISGYCPEAFPLPNIDHSRSIFLQKPFSLEDLTNTIRRILDDSQ